jgi:hypothetical protein
MTGTEAVPGRPRPPRRLMPYPEREALKELAYRKPMTIVAPELRRRALQYPELMPILLHGSETAMRASLILVAHYERDIEGKRRPPSFAEYAASWVWARSASIFFELHPEAADELAGYLPLREQPRIKPSYSEFH